MDGELSSVSATSFGSQYSFFSISSEEDESKKRKKKVELCFSEPTTSRGRRLQAIRLTLIPVLPLIVLNAFIIYKIVEVIRKFSREEPNDIYLLFRRYYLQKLELIYRSPSDNYQERYLLCGDIVKELDKTEQDYCLFNKSLSAVSLLLSNVENEIENLLENSRKSLRIELIIQCLLFFINVPISVFLYVNCSVTIRNLKMVSKNFSNRANDLKKERRKTELLLNEMLPKPVAKALRSGKPVSAEFYHSVSIMFTDIANFQEISGLSKPMDLITLLNNVYNFIDAKIELHDVYKVETVGSVYMVAAGVPIRSDGHAKEVANLALDVKDATEDFVIPHLPERSLLLRIGAHCGSIVGGVVGNKCPRYCLFGDTVNTASRMQSSGSGF